MAQPGELQPTANLQPMDEAIAAALAETPAPHAATNKRLGEVRNLGIGLTGFAEAALLRSEHTSGDIQKKTAGVLGQYVKATSLEDGIAVHTVSESDPEHAVVFSGTVETNQASAHAIFYAGLLKSGFEDQPGLPEDALLAADKVRIIAAGNPSMQAGIDDLCAVLWAGELKREEFEMAESLTEKDSAVHKAAAEARQFLIEHGHVSDEMLDKVGHALGLAERTASSAVLGGSIIAAELHKVVEALSESTSQAMEHLSGAVDRALVRALGVDSYYSASPHNEAWAIGGLEMLAKMVGPEVVPEGIDITAFGRALAVGAVLSRPTEIFDPTSTNKSHRQMRRCAEIASILDFNQAEGLSLSAPALAKFRSEHPQAPNGQEPAVEA